MQSGLLTGGITRERAAQLPETDWRSRHPFFMEPLLSKHLKIVEQLRAISEHKKCSLSQLSLAWVLRHPEMTSAIVGARSPEQIKETAKGGDIKLTEAEIEKIEGILD